MTAAPPSSGSAAAARDGCPHGRSHGLDWSCTPRHELDLPGGLVQQQAGAADHRRAGDQRRAGERGRPAGVDRVQHRAARPERQAADQCIGSARRQRRDQQVGRRRAGSPVAEPGQPYPYRQPLGGGQQLCGTGRLAYQHGDVRLTSNGRRIPHRRGRGTERRRLGHRGQGSQRRLGGAAGAEQDHPIRPDATLEQGRPDADPVGVLGVPAGRRRQQGVRRADRGRGRTGGAGQLQRRPLERHGAGEAGRVRMLGKDPAELVLRAFDGGIAPTGQPERLVGGSVQQW